MSPCFNEAGNLQNLCKRITATCESERITAYEVLLVENGSSDGSEEIIRQLHAADPRIKMIQLSRNYGYHGALACGLAHSRGEWVAVLDADLQDPPEVVPRMRELAKQGYHVVYGVRSKRPESPFQRLACFLFYRLWRSMAEISVPVDAGDFCIMHRDVVDVLNRMPERQRFTRGLRAWSGFRQTGFSYERVARAQGLSKFTLRSSLHQALTGILDFSTLPLRLILWLGFFWMLGALTLLTAQVALGWLCSTEFARGTSYSFFGLTHTELLMLLLAGFQSLCLGVVAEYVGRLHHEVKQRPQYVIKQFLL